MLQSHFRPRPPEMDSYNCLLWCVRSTMCGTMASIFFLTCFWVYGPTSVQCLNVTSQKFLSGDILPLVFHPIITKLIPGKHLPETHKRRVLGPDRIINEFFMNFFVSAEVYFWSPFGHLPATFAQTRDSSSLNFSANFGISRAPLLGLEAEKRVFYTPPVTSVKPWVRYGYCGRRPTS